MRGASSDLDIGREVEDTASDYGIEREVGNTASDYGIERKWETQQVITV